MSSTGIANTLVSMQTLSQTVLALGVMTTVGFVWLVVLAFRTRVWWGLGVLVLSPLAAMIYGVKYWGKAKIPFLIFTATLLIGIWMMVNVIRNIEAARSYAMQQVEQQAPTQQEAVTEFLERRLALEQLKTSANSGREKDREAAAVTMAVLQVTKAGFPEKRWEIARTNFAKFLGRSDLTRLERRDHQQTLELVEKLRQNITRGTAQQVEPDASPHARIASTQTDVSSNMAKPVSLDTPKPVDATATTPPPLPQSQTPELTPSQTEPPPAAFPARIAVSQAGHYLGADVTLVEKDGEEQHGRLISVSHVMLQLQKRYPGGTITASYNISEIKSLALVQP